VVECVLAMTHLFFLMQHVGVCYYILGKKMLGYKFTIGKKKFEKNLLLGKMSWKKNFGKIYY
jgi:hypothetical protein